MLSQKMVAIKNPIIVAAVKTPNIAITQTTQYELIQTIFDPFSVSPPNVFISKLKQRMNTYELCINDANRKSE